LIALLGGTIGNLPPQQRSGFLRRIANLLDPDDRFLLGVDLIKDPAALVAAYDDSQGVTAEFNRNSLEVLNDRFDGNFDPEAFEHVALWDSENLWIEMRLRSLREQQVRLDSLDLDLDFSQGEEMRTEISTKFARDGLETIFAEAELELTDWFASESDEYALALARSAR
jgi:L-histidine N-alpha-methyltransferase